MITSSPRRCVLLTCLLLLDGCSGKKESAPKPTAAPPSDAEQSASADPPEAGEGREVSVAAWRKDLEVLATELPRLHLNLFAELPRAEFEAAVRELAASVPGLTDDQVKVRLARLIARVGDGHTALSLHPQAQGYRVFPLRLYWFPEGVHAIATDSEHAWARGKKLVRIGDTPVEEVAAAVGELLSHDNEYQLRNEIPTYLVTAEILVALGFFADPESGRFVFLDEGKERPLDLDSIPALMPVAWSSLPEKDDLPLYLQKPQLPYWNDFLKEQKTLYFKYNRCADKGEMTFAQLVQGTFGFIDSNPVDRLVIDLRHNGGGNSELFEPLIEQIERRPALSRKGHLFVIVGRATFSSALLNAVDLVARTKAIVVGEPTGGKPNHFGEVRMLRLPNAKLDISYSTKFFKRVESDVDALYPDLRVETGASDYFAGRDPVLEAILKYRD